MYLKCVSLYFEPNSISYIYSYGKGRERERESISVSAFKIRNISCTHFMTEILQVFNWGGFLFLLNYKVTSQNA